MTGQKKFTNSACCLSGAEGNNRDYPVAEPKFLSETESPTFTRATPGCP